MGTKVASVEAKRCAIYTRKSTHIGLDQQFNSLDAQRDTCLRYIQNQPGWRALPESYDDGGFTGKNTDRPAFQRLLADVEAGKVDVIVVYKLDRFSRSLLDFLKLQEQLDARGCAVVSVTQNFNTADAMGRLILNVLLSFAQFEREMIAERIRDKVAAARRKGKWTGGNVPFGFEVKDKRLVHHPTEAATVRRAFELFVEHQQLLVVARVLNEQRLPGRGGSPWTKVAVRRLIRNPLYAGLCRAGNELAPGEHEAIVAPETFQRAQVILEGRLRERTHHGRNDEYLLQGLLRCGRCGAAMTPASTRKGGRSYRYYRCSARNKNGADACRATNAPAASLEQYVVQSLVGSARGVISVAEAKATLEVRVEERRRELEVERAALPAHIASASAKAAQYLDELTGLDGPAREVAQRRLREESERLEALEQRLTETDRQVAALAERTADAAWVAKVLGDFRRIWDVLSVPNRKRLLHAVVEQVTFGESGAVIHFALPGLGDGVAA